MTSPENVYTPYSTLVGLLPTAPTWPPTTVDQERVLSYEVYEKIYWTVPTVFKLSMRGTEDKPIYVPSGRTIVETTHRFLCPEFSVTVIDRLGAGTTEDVTAAQIVLDEFFRREQFFSKFNGAKRFSLIQGDWIWHVTADPTKPIGSRLSIHAIDPSMYFPVTAEDDLTKILAVHLVQLVDRDGTSRIHRQTYKKIPQADGTNRTTVSEGIFETDNWFPLDSTPLEIIRAEEQLPDQITTIPVYHIRNFDEPGNPFGSSEMRGIERLMLAINQTLSDEELSLALDGIGMYATDAPQPVDPTTGQAIPWRLGPGRVVHHPTDTTWQRITGVTSMGPYGEHYDRVWEALKQSSNTPDIAIGMVEVSAAESGVALMLKLSPMLAKVGEKAQIILDIHTNLFFDLLNMWYPAYEDTTFDNVTVQCAPGSAVPVNRDERFRELNDMLSGGVIDTEYYRQEVTKLGYVFPDDMQARVDAEREKNQDEFSSRLAAERQSSGDDSPDSGSD
jgi:Phage portal protein, SPP1 Gp6-like